MDTYYYAMRLTPYPNNEIKTKFCRERLADFIQAIGGDNYIIGQEYENNFHFHVVFSYYGNEFFPQKKKDIKTAEIKELLYTVFEVPEKKKGNPTFELKSVRSLEKALSYAVKDGDYDYSDGWADTARDAYENSFEKTHSLKRSLGDLTDKYMKGEIYDRDLWIGLGQSRADLGIPLSLKWIDEMVLSIQCKKDPTKLISIWEDMEIRKQLKS